MQHGKDLPLHLLHNSPFALLSLYKLFIFIYYFFIRVASFWNAKAKAWVDGRKGVFSTLQKQINPDEKIIWLHCASAGELEQGKPVLESLKKSYPLHKILVSFFSPSGYSAGKKYGVADYICFLPLDTDKNASRFLNIINPELVIFVKYDFWFFHLQAIHRQKIPLILIDSIFRKKQVFFRGYGNLHRKMLHFFTKIFVQDRSSLELLHSLQIQHCNLAGDTRFDRVMSISESFTDVLHIEKFIDGKPVLVAGSTWQEDEELISGLTQFEDGNFKLIIAPHEIHSAHIKNIIKLFPSAVTYSSLDPEQAKNSDILIINNMGMLSRLYRYATISYIGGGFNKSGIHNTLEAAVWGKPVVFGPNYSKFKEAKELITFKAAFSVRSTDELKAVINNLIEDKEVMNKSGTRAREYVKQNGGATELMIKYIQENRLLTTA